MLLEENKKITNSYVCDTLRSVYGNTTSNPSAYFQRSLLNFTEGFKSDILFIQGLNDKPIQLYSWPKFKQDVKNCTSCQNTQFVEVDGAGAAQLGAVDRAEVAGLARLRRRRLGTTTWTTLPPRMTVPTAAAAPPTAAPCAPPFST